jgi:hypothetical protein
MLFVEKHSTSRIGEIDRRAHCINEGIEYDVEVQGKEAVNVTHTAYGDKCGYCSDNAPGTVCTHWNGRLAEITNNLSGESLRRLFP